ncbi:hypothetical protein KSS87_004611 [Heliosperma pusillum]|nr:hypothetical protein KSS87_004611 [Heliosperma pusillum]
MQFSLYIPEHFLNFTENIQSVSISQGITMAWLYLLALCCPLLFLFFSTIHLLKPRKSPGTPDLPPGSMGWPIIGETFQFVSNPEKFIQERRQKYSPDIFKTSIIGEKVIILCGPSANKFIFANENKLFTFWLPPSVAAVLAVTNIDFTSASMNLVSIEAHKLLKAESLQDMVPIMDVESRQHLDTHWTTKNELKIHPLAQMFTFSLSCRLFINCTPEQVKQLFSYFSGMNGGGICFKINFPGTEYYQSRKREKALRMHLTEIIKQRKLEITKKEDASFDGYQDLLTRILISCKLNGLTIKDKELASRIISLLFASFFTTSNTVTFTLGYLAQYPHIYAKVLQEQLEIAKSKEAGDVLNWKDIQKMKYTWNVVCESMRLRSPAFGSFREAITDFTYAGFTVPKGWKVVKQSGQLGRVRSADPELARERDGTTEARACQHRPSAWPDDS